MKKLILLIPAAALFASALMLSGCSDETVADPEIIKARDAQREAMAPGNNGGPPPGAAGSDPGAGAEGAMQRMQQGGGQ